MQDVICRLAVSLSLETAAFEKGATLAEKRMGAMQRNFAKMGNDMAKVGQTLTLALSAPFAAFAIKGMQASASAADGLSPEFSESVAGFAAHVAVMFELVEAELERRLAGRAETAG